MPSLLELLATVDADRDTIRTLLADHPLARDALAARAWPTIRRPEQAPPDGGWTIWLIVTGRGWGKTRTAAEWSVRRATEIMATTGQPTRWAVVGQTFTDGRDVMMEGESGLLRCIPPSRLRKGNIDDSWNRSLGELLLDDGSIFRVYSAERARRLRGPQFHGAWADEVSSWADATKGPAQDTTWSNLMLGLRLPPHPQIVVTTTPKRNALTRTLLADAIRQRDAIATDGRFAERDPITGMDIWHTEPTVVLTRGTTFDNLSNLAPEFAAQVLSQYEGTRLGQQELYGEMLTADGTLLRPEWLPIIDTPPPCKQRVRVWDLAGSEPSDANPDPDWTAGALVGRTDEGYTLLHMARFRQSPGRVEQRIVATARADGPDVDVWIEQEPGSAGKAIVAHYQRVLDGISRVRGFRPSGEKMARIGVLFAGPAEQGRVTIVHGSWVQPFLDECADYPDGDHDDQIDAVASAIDLLGNARPVDALHVPASAADASGWRI